MGNWSGDTSPEDPLSVRRFLDRDADGTYAEGTDLMRSGQHHVTDQVNQIDTQVIEDAQGGREEDAFEYDQAGNLTHDGEHFYVYDAWNRLVAVYEGSDATGTPLGRCEYDALGRRVKTVEGDPAAPDKTTRHVMGRGAGVLVSQDRDAQVAGGAPSKGALPERGSLDREVNNKWV